MTRKESFMLCFIIATFLLLILLLGYMKKKEIEAYNHVTGKNISFSDGLWLELRVSEAPTKEGK